MFKKGELADPGLAFVRLHDRLGELRGNNRRISQRSEIRIREESGPAVRKESWAGWSDDYLWADRTVAVQHLQLLLIH
jgi:hypothetical protein